MNRWERVGRLDEFSARKIKWKGDNNTEVRILLTVASYDDGFIELYDESEDKYYIFDYADFIRAVTAERMRHE